MPGLIVFGPNFLKHQGVSQVAAKPFPVGMTFDVDNMVEVLVAAGKTDIRIGSAVGTQPLVYDVGTPFSTCLMETKGLLQLPAAGEHNKAYWDVANQSNAAIKGQADNWLDVTEGIHISLSCTDPHMTVRVFAAGRKQQGTNIHVCVKPAGTRWEFDKMHG